jgi:hypothetical protein
MKSRLVRVALVAAFVGLLGIAASANAQPTYKLGVKPDTKPLATLKLEGAKLTRSELDDDPGFRMQYHFKKDGKTLDTVEARGNPTLDVPHKEAGMYTVVLELFYPEFKGGNVQKGGFRPVSDVLTYKVEAGEPAKVVFVPPPVVKAALLVQCGREKGAKQDEVVSPGYGYKLVQGMPFEGWAAPAAKAHSWTDPKEVRFELTVPAGMVGTLRLHFVDGDNAGRKQRLVFRGKPVGDFDSFGSAGKVAEVPLTAEDTKGGKVEVSVQNLNPAGNAVVSVVEVIAK